MGTTEIAPGWYPDAVSPGSIRYWDGTGWTSHMALPMWAPNLGHAGTPLPQPVKPRAPRRRPPLPAYFVAGTVLIGFPLAITVGVLVAHASAPAPLDVPALADARRDADNAAKEDVTAIGAAIKNYYALADDPTWPPPVVTSVDGTYTFDPIFHGDSRWSWPEIDASYGVALGAEAGDSSDTWCVWVEASQGTVKTWQVTNDGVIAGRCGLR